MEREIDKITEEYVESINKFDIKDLSFFKSINNIILNKKLSLSLKKYNDKVSFEDTYKYVSDFLGTIDKSYVDYFNDVINQGILQTPFIDDMNSPLEAYSVYSPITHKRKIMAPTCGTIMDSYTITHELFHDMNIPENYFFSINRNLFTETVSTVGEFLLEDNYRKKGCCTQEFTYNKKDIIFSARIKAILIDTELKLLELKLKNENINNDTIISLVSNKSFSEKYLVLDHIRKLEENADFDYTNSFRYVLALAFGSLIHQQILEDPNKIENVVWLNDNISSKSISEIFERFGLEISNNDNILKGDSLKMLKYAYSVETKRK